MLLLFGGGVRKKSVGSSISGGNFSRKRWHGLLEAQEAEREAIASKKRDARLAKRAAEHRAVVAAAEARRAAREAEAARGAAALNALQLAHAGQTLSGMHQLREVARMASAQASMAPTHDENDDDEALMLLLAHHYAH